MNKFDVVTEHIQSLGKPAHTGNKSSPGIKGENFQEALFNAFDAKEETEINSASGLKSLEEIAPISMPVIQEPSQVVNGKTNDLLDLLESYATQLEDTRISMKSLSPVVEKINETANGLLSATKTIENDESGLKQIATQTALTARNAYIKFQRGDLLL